MAILVSLNDILEFKTVGNFDGVLEINNLYHYRVNSVTGGDLQTLAAGLINMLHDGAWGLLSTLVHYTNVEARILDANGNLVNGQSLVVNPAFGDGTAGGEVLPPNVVYTFKYVRADASFRHGFKRYTGVSEGNQNKGLLASSAIAAVVLVADALASFVQGYTLDVDGNPDTPDLTQSMVPIVLQRVINGDPIQPINSYDPITVVFDKIGTQNSRKYGVGS